MAIGTGSPTEAEVRQALQRLDPLWDELFPAEKERIVKLLVQDVTVRKDGLQIRLYLHGLNSLVVDLNGAVAAEGDALLCAAASPGRSASASTDPTAGPGQTLTIEVPMKFSTRGGRKDIILPPDVHAPGSFGVQRPQPLVVATAKTLRWQGMIEHGHVSSIKELACLNKVAPSFIARISAWRRCHRALWQMLWLPARPQACRCAA